MHGLLAHGGHGVRPAVLVAVGAELPPAPAHPPACGFPARAPVGGRTRPAWGAWGPHPFRSAGSRLGDMRVPGLCPGHALRPRPPSTGRLPSTLSAAASRRVLFDFSWVLSAVRPLLPSFSGSGSSASRTGPGTVWRLRRPGSPRFRRVPFRRNVVFDPGGAAAPRMAARTCCLRSCFRPLRPSATSGIFGAQYPPRRIAVYASPSSSPSTRDTRYRATRTLTRAGLPPAGTRQLRLAHQNLSNQPFSDQFR